MDRPTSLDDLPNELLLHVVGYLTFKPLYVLYNTSQHPRALVMPRLSKIALKCPSGLTPLQHAIQHSYICRARFLLENGLGNSFKRTRRHRKPIHDNTLFSMAVESTNVDLIKLLLEHGMDIDETNSSGDTAIHNAISQFVKHDDIPLVLLESYLADGESPFLDCVNVLLEWRPDLLIQNSDGHTPLHLAAMGLDPNPGSLALQSLLRHGTVVDFRSNSGHTALHYAAETGSGDHIRLLLRYGAGVNTRSNDGSTPYAMAVKGYELLGRLNKRMLRNWGEEYHAYEEHAGEFRDVFQFLMYSARKAAGRIL